MSLSRGGVYGSLALMVLSLTAGCSSSQDKGASGFLAVSVAGTGTPGVPLRSAVVTIVGIEARRADGSWVVVDSGLPARVDLVSLANSAGSVTLPADGLPEGQYTALSVRLSRADVTLERGWKLTIGPPGNAWVAQIPVDFAVVAEQETIVGVTFGLDRTFRPDGDDVEFDPEPQIGSVRRLR